MAGAAEPLLIDAHCTSRRRFLGVGRQPARGLPGLSLDGGALRQLAASTACCRRRRTGTLERQCRNTRSHYTKSLRDRLHYTLSHSVSHDHSLKTRRRKTAPSEEGENSSVTLRGAWGRSPPPSSHRRRHCCSHCQRGIAAGEKQCHCHAAAAAQEQYNDFSIVGGMGLISVPSSCSMRYLRQRAGAFIPRLLDAYWNRVSDREFAGLRWHGLHRQTTRRQGDQGTRTHRLNRSS